MVGEKDSIKDGYEYETEFMKLSQHVNRIMMQKSLGAVSCNRNKKKLHTCFGKVEAGKEHVLCQHTKKFGMSSKLQEAVCLVAQSHVFEDSEEVLCSLLGSSISGKQIQRVSEHYGERPEALSKSIEEGYNDAPALETKPSDTVYAMVDGSMVFTREEGWKEMKMGRIYAESSRVAIQSERTAVTDSLYVCHLGGHQDFLNKIDPYLDHYKIKFSLPTVQNGYGTGRMTFKVMRSKYRIFSCGGETLHVCLPRI